MQFIAVYFPKPINFESTANGKAVQESTSPEHLAIDAVTNAASILANILGPDLPWKMLRRSATQLSPRGSQMTKQNAESNQQIKTNFVNVFASYDRTEQTIYNWCENVQPILMRYVHSASQPSTFAQKLHIKLLVNVLNGSLNDFEMAQNQLGDLLSVLDLLSIRLRQLEVNLQRDYDENSSYFQKRLQHFINTPSNGRQKNVREAAANFKRLLISSLAFYQSLSAAVRRVSSVFAEADSQLPSQIHMIDQQKSIIEISINAPEQVSTDLDAAIRSAGRLISMCQEYHREHEKN